MTNTKPHSSNYSPHQSSRDDDDDDDDEDDPATIQSFTKPPDEKFYWAHFRH